MERVKRYRVLTGYSCIKNRHQYALQGGIHNETSNRVNTRAYFITILYPFERIGRCAFCSNEGSSCNKGFQDIKPYLRSDCRLC